MKYNNVNEEADAEIANLNQQLSVLLKKKAGIMQQASGVDTQINTLQQTIAQKIAAKNKPQGQTPQKQVQQPQAQQQVQQQQQPQNQQQTASVAPPQPTQK